MIGEPQPEVGIAPIPSDEAQRAHLFAPERHGRPLKSFGRPIKGQILLPAALFLKGVAVAIENHGANKLVAGMGAAGPHPDVHTSRYIAFPRNTIRFAITLLHVDHHEGVPLDSLFANRNIAPYVGLNVGLKHPCDAAHHPVRIFQAHNGSVVVHPHIDAPALGVGKGNHLPAEAVRHLSLEFYGLGFPRLHGTPLRISGYKEDYTTYIR